MHRTATAHREEHRFDVCVVGGGMSGICAAIAAARHGMRTCLVQDRPVLGGNASSEIRMWICGAHGASTKETGILEEVQLANQARNPAANYHVWDAVLHDAVAQQPNLALFLNCSCTGTEAEGPAEDRRLGAITCWQLTTQTWHRIEAATFIDCSGDGVLAVDSGAWFMQGREAMADFGEDIEPEVADEKTMGNSILLQIRHCDGPRHFTPAPGSYRFDEADFPFRMKGVRGHNFWWIELGGIQDTILDAERIRAELHDVVWGVWDYIKNRSPERADAANWELEWIGAIPGKRENRRFTGHHVLCQDEVRSGGAFDDLIAYGGWSMDDHHPAGLLYPGQPTIHHQAPSPFGIPLRSLISKNVRNLLFAGRNISTTHAALSSTRVMATCALLGQAAGTAAALARRQHCDPADLSPTHVAELQQLLMADDVWLPGHARGIDALARQANCDAPQLLSGHDRPLGEDEQVWLGESGEVLRFDWDRPVQVGGLRVVCDSNLQDRKKMPCAYPAAIKLPDTLLRHARVEVDRGDGEWRCVHRISDNTQRLLSMPVGCEARSLRLVPEATWGGSGSEVRLFAAEPMHALPERALPAPQRRDWGERVAEVDPADLEPPENQGDGRRTIVGA